MCDSENKRESYLASKSNVGEQISNLGEQFEQNRRKLKEVIMQPKTEIQTRPDKMSKIFQVFAYLSKELDEQCAGLQSLRSNLDPILNQLIEPSALAKGEDISPAAECLVLQKLMDLCDKAKRNGTILEDIQSRLLL
jgi:hypothetical protein